MSAGSTSPRAGFPDRAILCKGPRVSELRNATTAECETSWGNAVEVSFWLVDPPGVSYFSVNCPGLDTSHFDDDMDPPWLICAEAAFVLFTVTVRGTTDHFVYTAGPAGKQSLQLLPDPNIGLHRKHPYALLPLAGGEHYAVAFLDRHWISQDVGWRFNTSIFSSEMQAWRRSRVSLQHLSESDKSLCGHHGLSKQIAVGGDSLGWVDLARGILLLQNLFDDDDRQPPVIRFIPFPESRVRFLDEDGIPYLPDEYYCNVSCCDHLIKFIHIERDDDPTLRTIGQGWRATMWNRNISWNKWRRGSVVDVANISVDQSYSALLPVLRRGDDEIQRLELKRLSLHTLVPSVHHDDIVYMMAKVNDKEDTAWVIAIDMERAAVEAMAAFSAEVYDLVDMYRPCVFPKHLNMTPGTSMGNPVDRCFKRLSAKQCLVQVLWTLDWLRELDQCLEIERSTYNTFRLLLQLSPVPSLRSNIGSMVKFASSCNGQGEAASEAVDSCLSAFDDFDLALLEPPTCQSASIEAMRSIISHVMQAVDSILRVVPSTLMPKELTPREAACYGKRGKSKPFSNSRAEKHRRRRKKNKGWGGKGGAVVAEIARSDMGNLVDKYFQRISASQCVHQVLLTQRCFRQLADQWLDSQGSNCIECRILLRYCCPASALRFDIQAVVKYASYNGQGEAASKDVDFCVRALDDFDKLLRESPLSYPSTTEAMKSQIGVTLGALDHTLEFVQLTHMPRGVQMMLADVCLKREEQVLVFGRCEEPCHGKGRSGEQRQAGRSNPSNSGEALN